MKIYLFAIYILFFLCVPFTFCFAQYNQTVLSGENVVPINFSSSVCSYKWVNDNPSIGLSANGTGNIASFVAVNNTKFPVIATITATPAISGFAYIADYFLNIVSVINLSTNAVVATIPVGLNPHNVDISRDGNFVYVANYHGGSISVINAFTNTVIGNIVTNDYQEAIVVSPDGKLAYSMHGGGKFSVINTITNTVVNTLSLNKTSNSMCISADGKYVYIAPHYSNEVLVFNTQNSAIEYSIPLGAYVNTVCLSPDDLSLYVTVQDNSVKVINTSTKSVSSVVSIAYPYATCISPDGKILYVTSAGNAVVAVNTITKSILWSIPAGPYSEGISLNQDGSRLYVANQGSSTVSVINTSTNALSASIRVGTNPYSLGNFVSSCKASPITFTITVNPNVPPPKLEVTGNLNALKTTYGSVSPVSMFNISGSDLTEGIKIKAPAGFEISLNNINFTADLILGAAGTVLSTPVYIRLSSTTPAGNYSGQIEVNSQGTGALTAFMPDSRINPAPLSVKADNKTKIVGQINPNLTLMYEGFVNGETMLQLTNLPIIQTSALTTSPVGEYLISASGAFNPNYEIKYFDGLLTILPASPFSLIPNGFTPNDDGINDFWDIKSLSLYPNSRVNVFNRFGAKVFSSIGYSIPWNGTYKGSKVATGIYYYVINVDGNVTSGSLTIMY